jgi:Methylamine utilisation protein MauE
VSGLTVATRGAPYVGRVLLRIVLGAVFAAMAVGQLASWAAIPAILGAYRLLPAAALPVLAAGLIAAELVCGIWFVTRPRSRAAAPV